MASKWLFMALDWKNLKNFTKFLKLKWLPGTKEQLKFTKMREVDKTFNDLKKKLNWTSPLNILWIIEVKKIVHLSLFWNLIVNSVRFIIGWHISFKLVEIWNLYSILHQMNVPFFIICMVIHFFVWMNLRFSFYFL
jgi:hypothetical protein